LLFPLFFAVLELHIGGLCLASFLFPCGFSVRELLSEVSSQMKKFLFFLA
jgi:hypothetical protein